MDALPVVFSTNPWKNCRQDLSHIKHNLASGFHSIDEKPLPFPNHFDEGGAISRAL
jgi:hypothetical protein